MSSLNYRVKLSGLTSDPSFREATREELRVLLALTERGGKFDSEDDLINAAGVSKARCRAALTFWEGCGFIKKWDGSAIIDEFEERVVRGEIDEEPATSVAASIRDESLASMIDECAALLGQACLSNPDVKSLTGLHTQYKLSPEYIVTLAAHLASKGRLSVRILCDRAIRLADSGCTSIESLEAYITNLEKSNGTEWEFRRALGIYNTLLSPTQKEYFRKWSEDFGYSSAILSEAYDIAVMNTKSGRGDLRYIDSVLTSWFNAGCKTVSECRAYSESEKEKRSQTARATGKCISKSEPEKPRYGDFDVFAAFDDAIDRSFGGDKD